MIVLGSRGESGSPRKRVKNIVNKSIKEREKIFSEHSRAKFLQKMIPDAVFGRRVVRSECFGPPLDRKRHQESFSQEMVYLGGRRDFRERQGPTRCENQQKKAESSS